MPRGIAPPPDRPARPDRPVLCSPRDLPRRRITASAAGRVALIHAIAHIELNAVDLRAGHGVPFCRRVITR